MSISFFRERYKWMTRVILIIIVVSFIFSFGYFGVTNLQNSSVPTGTVAKVNGEKISLAQFYNARQSLHQQLGVLRNNLNSDLRQFINGTAIQQLVEIKLLAQKARELGFYISDDELNNAITNDPNLQFDGRFIGAEAYRSFIRQNLNISVGDFEEYYKEDLLRQKITELINRSVKVTEDELYNIYKIENEKTSLYYAEFKAEDIANPDSVSDDEIKNYYVNNPTEFLTLEKRKIKFAKISKDAFASITIVSDGEIGDYYKYYNDEFRNDDRSLKSLDDVKSEIAKKLKTKRTYKYYEDFMRSISDEEDIEQIDQILAENSLGQSKQSEFFSLNQNTGEFPDEVRKKVFSIEVGDTSYIKSVEELWIFELTDVEPPKQIMLEGSGDHIIEILSIKKGREAAKIAAQETLNKLTKSKIPLKNATKKLRIKVNETAPFTRADPPKNLDIKDLTYDAFLLNNSNPTGKKIYRKGNSYFIISLKEKSEIDTEEYERQKPVIRIHQLQKRTNEILNDWLIDLRENSEVVINPNVITSQ